jgi:hypothetical protein
MPGPPSAHDSAPFRIQAVEFQVLDVILDEIVRRRIDILRAEPLASSFRLRTGKLTPTPPGYQKTKWKDPLSPARLIS